MQQANTQSVVQPVPAKTPIAPASQSAPLPLDPSLFHHVSGGDATAAATAGPAGNW